jgi:antitoxin (DNA-binding transcriptional repressor) of toxin-antitoxin stability system
MNSRKITQRELRNQNGETLRAVGRAETFVITRGGVDVGVLAPLPGRRCVARETFLAACAGAARLDGARFHADLDAVVDQDPIQPV